MALGMSLLADSDYGGLEPLVRLVSALATAAAAIGLTWRRRAKWEPSEEDIPQAPARVGGLVAAVAIAIIWTQYGSSYHRPLVQNMAIAFAILCVLSLFAYTYLVARQVYDRPPGKVIGGFTLTPGAALQHSQQDMTLQQVLKARDYDADRVWPRGSRVIAKMTFILFYLGLTVGGTLALTCAAMLFLPRNVVAGAVWFTDKGVLDTGTVRLQGYAEVAPIKDGNFEFLTLTPQEIRPTITLRINDRATRAVYANNLPWELFVSHRELSDSALGIETAASSPTTPSIQTKPDQPPVKTAIPQVFNWAPTIDKGRRLLEQGKFSEVQVVATRGRLTSNNAPPAELSTLQSQANDSLGRLRGVVDVLGQEAKDVLREITPLYSLGLWCVVRNTAAPVLSKWDLYLKYPDFPREARSIQSVRQLHGNSIGKIDSLRSEGLPTCT